MTLLSLHFSAIGLLAASAQAITLISITSSGAVLLNAGGSFAAVHDLVYDQPACASSFAAQSLACMSDRATLNARGAPGRLDAAPN